MLNNGSVALSTISIFKILLSLNKCISTEATVEPQSQQTYVVNVSEVSGGKRMSHWNLIVLWIRFLLFMLLYTDV